MTTTNQDLLARAIGPGDGFVYKLSDHIDAMVAAAVATAGTASTAAGAAAVSTAATASAAAIAASKATPAVVKTADFPLITAGSGTYYSNNGTAALVTFTAPVPVAGVEYRFMVEDADGICFTADATSTIRMGASLSIAGGNLTCTAIGGSLHVKAGATALTWHVLSHEGTWSVT